MSAPAVVEERERLTKKALTADHPTWCPGCGDFAVLAAFYKILEKRQLPQESIVTLAGIGCSSRFPYFVNTHGAHFIHGRALPLASGVSLARPDLHVFLFGGDGDGFSIGGNHLEHGARKNIRLTYVIMDNFVYGLTKKQTSPTSPIGYRSKTDPAGAIDQPVNPIKKLDRCGRHVCRPHARHADQPHDANDRAGHGSRWLLGRGGALGVRRVFPGAFDAGNPRKGGAFGIIDERKWDNSPEDEARHDVTDEIAAFRLANLPFPGVFGVFYEIDRPTKNSLETKWIAEARAKSNALSDQAILQQTFDRMK